MDKRIQIAIIVLVIAAAAAAFLTRDPGSRTPATAPEPAEVPVAVAPEPGADEPAAVAPESTRSGEAAQTAAASLPRFVEVGADSCVPCKMMQPILDELRRDYAGKLEIEFADVWKDPALGDRYGVRSIPTQVIYDADGREVFRHTGFWPKEDIDAKLRELGIVE